jgi:hypothetical protein
MPSFRRPAPVVRRPPARLPARLPPKPVPAVSRPQVVARTLDEARAVVPDLRRRAEELLAIIQSCKARVGADFYEMATALAELDERKLYGPLGYASFAAMVEQRGLMSASAAFRLVAIYRAIPRSTALQLGPDKAFEWLRLLRAQAGPEAETEDVRKLAEEKTEVRGKPIAELSVREIAELRRRVQERRAAGRRDPAAGDAHRLARALAQRLNAIGAGDARVGSRWAGGRWRVRADLGLDALRTLLGRTK